MQGLGAVPAGTRVPFGGLRPPGYVGFSPVAVRAGMAVHEPVKLLKKVGACLDYLALGGFIE